LLVLKIFDTEVADTVFHAVHSSAHSVFDAVQFGLEAFHALLNYVLLIQKAIFQRRYHLGAKLLTCGMPFDIGWRCKWADLTHRDFRTFNVGGLSPLELGFIVLFLQVFDDVKQ
jgi:hypothetical protein